ncbi:ubiquitin-conjugating enzyme and catalytic subunit of SCF ubiquitin-protein ligase complex [Scheffersomyces coipomensis]|uniref:ubiquitin-conjugating enzyme and catalytic subunit of SCF ubiquitin-protein ligase complex n=1 Tax=Scheffersomyces coipomensis TaxID=1788519 RepID=UPI00315D2997
MSRPTAALLQRQFKELTDPKKVSPFHIDLDDDNIFLWNIGMMVFNKESIYHGGYFKGSMKFPPDFPFSPPTFRFTPPLYHPNIYRDGRVCISILHQGGDPTNDEPDNETWSPAQSVESVLISILSLLEDPNVSSPANIDASVELRKNPDAYKRKVLQEVEHSKQNIPEGFVMPDSEAEVFKSNHNRLEIEQLNDDFWSEYDDEDDYEEDDYDHDDDDEVEDDESVQASLMDG